MQSTHTVSWADDVSLAPNRKLGICKLLGRELHRTALSFVMQSKLLVKSVYQGHTSILSGPRIRVLCRQSELLLQIRLARSREHLVGLYCLVCDFIISDGRQANMLLHLRYKEITNVKPLLLEDSLTV